MKFEKRRSHDFERWCELVVVTGKDEESKKGRETVMRRVADETNLESLNLPCQLLQQFMPCLLGDGHHGGGTDVRGG